MAHLEFDHLYVANRPLLSDDGLYMVSPSRSVWWMVVHTLVSQVVLLLICDVLLKSVIWMSTCI